MASPPARRRAIVALANAGVGIKTIANFARYSISSVRRWIRRAKGELGELHDRARSGRPAIYSQEVQLRIVAFYCQTQPLPNCGRWSLRWAECQLKAGSNVVGAAPGKSTLHRILQGNRLKPHQSRYFLQITDPDFFPKLEHLLDLYRDPPANLFFFDECPGIQILKRLTPDVQTDLTRKRLEEFEYIRNGTMDVFAFLQHADGKVHLECRADHKTDTLVEVFTHQVNQLPQSETVHYVMDNLSSHRSYPFCELVAHLSNVECPPKKVLSTQDERVAWLGREDKRVVIHFTPFHGSWLNWVESWFGIMGSKVLGESFGWPDELKMALEAFAEAWNTLLAHPFKWTYDGKGLHNKAVIRFTKMLHSSVEQMDLRILTKQFLLASNLLRDYVSEVRGESWEQLWTALRSQSALIANLIQSSDRPRAKIKALKAFEDLNEALYNHIDSTPQAKSA